MKSLLKKILFGDTAVTEYSTITIAGDIKEKAYLQTACQAIDISTVHWLLCLEPIVIGIWLQNPEEIKALNTSTRLKIIFTDSAGVNKNTTAVLELHLFNSIEENNGTLFLLKLTKCKLHHLNFIKTRLLFSRYYKKPGLSFKKFKSLVAGYSYPRKVRIVSFKEESYYNIFPMDLVGDISHVNRFVFGLRHTNIALSKIIAAGKLVISEISYEHKNIIYQLGKHHGASPPLIGDLPFKVRQTKTYGFYIPEFPDSYKEIKILKTLNLGSHMLMWGEVINEEVLKPLLPGLYHIHFLQYLHQQAKGFNYPLV
ncbi:MAG: hypothetical protein JWN83_29 [Chitinophagaceae bacterium]|nr:hypothetical protein [Chitinophagaceae bacterium]